MQPHGLISFFLTVREKEKDAFESYAEATNQHAEPCIPANSGVWL
jgi:hypothetical protein